MTCVFRPAGGDVFPAGWPLSGTGMPVNIGKPVSVIAKCGDRHGMAAVKTFRPASDISRVFFSLSVFLTYSACPCMPPVSDRRVVCRFRYGASAGGMCAGEVLPICPAIMTSVNAAY